MKLEFSQEEANRRFYRNFANKLKESSTLRMRTERRPFSMEGCKLQTKLLKIN